MRNKLLFILALVCGLAAAASVYLYLDRLETTYRTNGDFTSVVVARQHIKTRTAISAESLDYQQVPTSFVHPEAYRSIKDVAGKISTADIFPGEQVLKPRTSTTGNANADLALTLNPGERAVSLPVNDVSGVSGLLKVGDHVDAAVTFDLANAQTSTTYTSTIVQNIRVLVAKRTSIDGEQREGNHAQTVVLAVTPGQAQQLMLGSERGSIRLMLRSPADAATLTIPSVKMEHLVR